MPDTLKRITPSEIPAMYRRLGMRPIIKNIGRRGDDCGCLLGMLVVESGSDTRECSTLLANDQLESEGFDRSYLVGLFKGFDGTRFAIAASDIEQLGIDDGRAAREALVKEGMM